jgi:tetratricopeptide (TPR) repeat protein
MSSRVLVAAIVSTLVAVLSVAAQDPARPAPEPAPAQPVSPAVQPAAPAQAAPASVASKADALLLYKQGRDLEAAGKKAEAETKYRESVLICERELAGDPTRMDAYTVKCWSLFRLDRYREVVDVGAAGLKVKFDARIVEVMGEAYFHLGDDASSVRYLQRYLDNVGEYGDRVPTAYFYMAESYVRQKRLDHADIAYSLAVYREPGIGRWWYRYAALVESLGEYARAHDLYGKALRLSPGMAEAVSGLARVKARL